MKLIRYEYPALPALSRLENLNRWLDQAMADWPSLTSAFSPWTGDRGFQPAVDLYEDPDHFHARFELPGVKKDQIRLELENQVLTVTVRQGGTEKDGESSFEMSRSISVPDGIDPEKIKARHEDGILTVSLPKQERRKPRAIEVK